MDEPPADADKRAVFFKPDFQTQGIIPQGGRPLMNFIPVRFSKCLLLPALVLFLLAVFCPESRAAEAGIKYNRTKAEYPEKVLTDMRRFNKDRIRTVMIALPWAEWESGEGRIDEAFIKNQLAPVLSYCEAHKIKVILSSHCSFWEHSGNWTIPPWIRLRSGFTSAVSALTDPGIREEHTAYLKRLVDATHGYPAVTGYNILNEPVAATHWYIKDKRGRADFDSRWEGVLSISRSVKKYMRQIRASQSLMIGNGSSEEGYEKYVWENNGTLDLNYFWTETLDRIAGQSIPLLRASAEKYPGRSRVRTEGILTYKFLEAWKKAGDMKEVKARWEEGADESPVLFDYDAAYDYEGEGNASVPDLEAFYVWRAGSIEGSEGFTFLLDHKRGDRPTPYYSALRDLASGIDSFEALDPEGLPRDGASGLLFNPDQAKPGISKRWTGTGVITGQKEVLPPGLESRAAARIRLEAGQFIFRSVIPAHWKDNGVKSSDSLDLWVFSEKPAQVDLSVKTGRRVFKRKMALIPGWQQYRAPLKSLGITEISLPDIRGVGFENSGPQALEFFVDDFLIRA